MVNEPIIWVCVAVFCFLIFGIIRSPPPPAFNPLSCLNARYIPDNSSETTADESVIESEC